VGLEARGEATGLVDGVARVVLCAQAFHWFDPNLSLPELQRILRPGGWVALMWNDRAETAPFTAAYGAVIQSPQTRVVTNPARPKPGS
jgi:SAM-dependent methyltransferase